MSVDGHQAFVEESMIACVTYIVVLGATAVTVALVAPTQEHALE